MEQQLDLRASTYIVSFEFNNKKEKTEIAQIHILYRFSCLKCNKVFEGTSKTETENNLFVEGFYRKKSFKLDVGCCNLFDF